MTLAFILLGCAIFIALTGWGNKTAVVTTSITESSSQIASTPDSMHKIQPPKTPQPEKLPPSFAEGIYISPASLEISKGEDFNINVMAKFANYGISGSEITLDFDPSVFQATDLIEGDLLGANPVVGTEEKDNQVGMTHYALARKGATQITDSDGVLATIKFHVLDSAPNGTHNLTLTEVKLTDQKFKEITGFDVQNGSVEVVP